MELKSIWGTLGLPLIGTDCVFIGTNDCESNHKLLVRGTPVHILAHYEQNNGTPLAAFTFTAGDDETYIGGAMGSLFEPLKTAAQIAFDEKCERVSMFLLGKETDPSPGFDWSCSRNWTVNRMREQVRQALEAEQ